MRCSTGGLCSVVWFLFALLLSLVDVQLVSSSHVFDVYRLVQFEAISATGKQLFGSHKATFTLQATTLSSKDLTRSVVIIPLAEIDLATFESIVGKASAVLVLLPERQAALPKALVDRWNSIEGALLGREVKIPVYFAFTDLVLRELYSYIESSSQDTAYGNFGSALSTDTYTLAVSAAGDPVTFSLPLLVNLWPSCNNKVPIKEMTVTNLQVSVVCVM